MSGVQIPLARLCKSLYYKDLFFLTQMAFVSFVNVLLIKFTEAINVLSPFQKDRKVKSR